ncbi:mechanosensitive ion channel family protein [Collimonas sp.]|jgi:small conductance mechanosensitive channel|uniref:mechanosensitive ion channel family protein n=1 Tax=Collimonas sp. TaxID=1963772 RepID=UPI002C04619D|nr:mechanosensitive ion channel family protein [Collimonas sp.]HWX01369.1 mechanosensitive ion channel family protein [Collimonas sp.]
MREYTRIVDERVAVLGQFGVQTTSIVAILGAAGLAIGLALQGTLQNIAAGMMLLCLRPFQVGEYISNGTIEGTIDEIGLFTTQLTRADGICLHTPNNQLWNSALTNYSRNNTRRIDIPIGISYKDDPAVATQALQKLLLADERILVTPTPLVVVTDHADSAVMLNLRAWTTTSEYWEVRWSIAQKLQAALAAVNCSIPFPMRELRITHEAETMFPAQQISHMTLKSYASK